MDEKALIKWAVGGDKEAFAALYMMYRDDLYRYAYFRLGSAEDAEDAVSACIVEAYESIYLLRYSRAFKAWIFRILYRCCCELVKEQIAVRSREDAEALDTLPAPESGLSPELKEAFEILSPEDRDIVLLSVIAGYNSKEIARATGLNASTVRSRLSRSLAKMRAFLSPSGEQSHI